MNFDNLMKNKWRCEDCRVANDNSLKKCKACEKPRPGVTQEEIDKEKNDLISSFLGKPITTKTTSTTTASTGMSGAYSGGGASLLGNNVSTGGGNTTGSTTGASLFGNNVSTGGASTGGGASLFGNNVSTGGASAGVAPTGASIFGNNVGAANNSGKVQGFSFGTKSATSGPSTTAASIFGIAKPTDSSIAGAQKSLFGSTGTGGVVASTTTGASVFNVFGESGSSTIGAAGKSNAAPAFGATNTPVGGFVFNTAAVDAKANGNKEHAKRAKKNKYDNGTLRKPTRGQDCGDVLVCGSGECDQLGLGEGVFEKKKPTIIKTLSDKKIISVACGAMHTLVLTSKGEVYSWGCNDDGALGRKSTGVNGVEESLPGKINFYKRNSTGDPIYSTKVCAGDNHSVALDGHTGKVYLWGTYNGYIGFPDYTKFNSLYIADEKPDAEFKVSRSFYPIGVKNLPKIKDIACGDNHTLALTAESNEIFSWGGNPFGQLAQGNSMPEDDPSRYENATEEESQKLKKEYKAKKVQFLYPKQVILPRHHVDNNATSNSYPVSIGCGGETSFVIMSNGKVYGSGLNGDGQLGQGSCGGEDPSKSSEPFYRSLKEIKFHNDRNSIDTSTIIPIPKISQIGGGIMFSMAFDRINNIVYSWGRNRYLGIGKENEGNQTTPKPMNPTTKSTTKCNNTSSNDYLDCFANCRISKFACGGSHAFVLTEGGDIFGWGAGDMYQVGNTPPDLDNFTNDEKNVEEGPNEAYPRLIHATSLGEGIFKKLNNKEGEERYILDASGGAQHSVFLAWNPKTGHAGGHSGRNLKRDRMEVSREEMLLDEPKKSVGFVGIGSLENTTDLKNNSGISHVSKLTPQKTTRVVVGGMGIPLNMGGKAMASGISEGFSTPSPPKKRTKLYFSSKVVQKCLKEVKELERTRVEIDPEILKILGEERC